MDVELKVEDRPADTSGSKGIPIGLDDLREVFFVGHR